MFKSRARTWVSVKEVVMVAARGQGRREEVGLEEVEEDKIAELMVGAVMAEVSDQLSDLNSLESGREKTFPCATLSYARYCVCYRLDVFVPTFC